MMPIRIKKIWAVGIAVMVVLAVGAWLCYQKTHQLPPAVAKLIAKELPESFTFFDLGANTRFSSTVRSALSDRLGSDAIAYRGQIDLSVNEPNFLKTYFPDLHALNQALNFPPRERIEHNTIKLMYRYARKVGVPFPYVEMVFSGYSRRPLYFSISVSQDGAAIIETLKQKYGLPDEIKGLTPPLKAVYWRKNKDLLLITEHSDRYGNPEYHLMIYYVNSLQELLNIEKEEARQREDRIKQASEKAF